jgi:hypothetical protein
MSAITAFLTEYGTLTTAVIAAAVIVTGFFAGRKLVKRI